MVLGRNMTIRIALGAAAAGVCLIFGLAGCHAELFTKAADEPGSGVPLTEFAAKDGQYFPPFITKFRSEEHTSELQSLTNPRMPSSA